MYFFFFFPDESNNLQTDLGFNDVDWQYSANKGEWSELYALYKLLVDQNLFHVNIMYFVYLIISRIDVRGLSSDHSNLQSECFEFLCPENPSTLTLH